MNIDALISDLKRRSFQLTPRGRSSEQVDAGVDFTAQGTQKLNFTHSAYGPRDKAGVHGCPSG